MGSKYKHDCLEVSFPATQSQASAGIEALSTRLAEHGLPESKADDVKIALAEAINNVVEHACVGTTAADIQIDCSLCEKTLVIQITDSGDPMPHLRIPGGTPPPVDTALHELPEGGFGWHLIHQLASDITYERKDGGNSLSLRFDFDEMS